MDILQRGKHISSILTFLLEKGEVKKTDLSLVVSSPQTYQRAIKELEKEGYVVQRETIIGRKIVNVSLTPKGRYVAEQLKRAETAALVTHAYELPPAFDREFEGLSAMTHFNVLDDHVAIMEHNYDGTGKDRVVMVYVRLNGRGFMRLWCEEDENFDCIHVKYAWTLPKVQEMIQMQIDKGNMKA